MKKYNILATLLICSTLLFGCGQKNETSNELTKEDYLSARQSMMLSSYNDKYFDYIKSIRDTAYEMYSETFNMHHFDFTVETNTAEKMSESTVQVVFYYAYSEEEYDNCRIDGLIDLHKAISIDLYDIILEGADYLDLELKMGQLSFAFVLEDEDFNVLYSTITSDNDVMVLKNNLN